MTILDTVRDPNLFARWFVGESWRRWYVALAAIFALPIASLRPFGLTPQEALTIFSEHTGRRDWPVSPAAEFWGLMGRRGAKSRTMALLGVFVACFRTYTLAPGERATVMLLAADKRQARVLRRYIGAFIDETPMLAAMVTGRTRESIDLNNGVTIEVHVASYRTTRGYTCAAIIADEICFWRTDDDSANPDSEVLNALRPSMATIPGALLMAISSPYAKRGEAWKTYKRYWAVDGARVMVWRASTAQMNPTIDPEIIARAYEDDEAAARSEYGGEWREDIQSFLDREQVEALVVEGVTEVAKQSAPVYVAHCDPSGGRADSMTLAIGHREAKTVVLDHLGERRPPFQPSTVVAEFADTLQRYGLSEVQTDNYAAEWVVEAFRDKGITVRLSERSTSHNFRELLPLVTGGAIALLDDRRLVNQLGALERRITRGGQESIGHPPGGHDDLAAAVAGVAAQLTRAARGGTAEGHAWWL